jgi:molecular chaperone DnaK (HSP70)
VDVGAGTTDVSFFRLADITRQESRVMAFYDAGTSIVGSDDLDRGVAHYVLSRMKENWGPVESLTGNIITACRLAKERIEP